jgi:N-acetylglucosamine kinase-like BadF-type ATPase
VAVEYFLGVDGGQSSTLALIGDGEGRVLGRGVAGPCNHVGASEGRAKFLGAIGGSLRAACDQAGPKDTPEFISACLGFSGGPQDKDVLTRELVKAASFTITDDAVIALSGALAGEPGAITIAGTGSIAFARNRNGESARAGGWGYLFGDEGGGFDIARQALRAALRFEEGWGPRTALHGLLLGACQAENAHELMHRFYTTEYPRPAIGRLAVLVDEAANSGDPEAARILRESAEALAKIANAVCLKLFGKEDIAVAFVGGVFKSRLLMARFIETVENRVVTPRFGPAAGALIEAYRAVGRNVALTHLPEEKH